MTPSDSQSNRGGPVQPVERPRLVQRFMEGLPRKLTLVEAPLGYGKTTLISAWIRQLKQSRISSAYLSFDGLDGNHVERITQALAHLGITTETKASAEPDTDLPAAPCHKRCCLFLDDFHEADPEARDLLHRLLRQSSDCLHLIIGSREAPGFPLTKLRMADQVTDFTLTDLRFDHNEAHALFQGLLTDETLDTYLHRAEGWVAALQLLKQFGLSESDEPPDFDKLSELANYLNEQYYERLNKEQQHLLVLTAHVSRVDGDLADQLTKRANSWSQLVKLAATNALIFEDPDKSKPAYRYHQLLRDFLRNKQHFLGRARLTELHQQTSRYYAESGDVQLAMKHASLSGDMEAAATLLLNAGGVQYGMVRGAERLAICLEHLSTAQIMATPRLCVSQAYLLLKQGRLQEAADLLLSVRADLDPHDHMLEREIILVEAHARIYQDLFITQRQLAALEHTVSVTPVTDPLSRGLLSNFLCIVLIEHGDFEKARTVGDRAMSLYKDIGAEHLQMFMYLHLSVLDLELRTLAEARHKRERAQALCNQHFSDDQTLCAITQIYLDEALFESGQTTGMMQRLKQSLKRIDRTEGWNMLYLSGYETCLSLLLENEKNDEAVDLCEQAGHLVARRGMQLFSNQLMSMQLDLAVRLGAEKEAERLAAKARLVLADNDNRTELRWRGRIRILLALARHEASTGNGEPALRHAHHALKLCQQWQLPRLQLRALNLIFLIHAQKKAPEATEAALKTYLLEANNHGSFGAILREGRAFYAAALWLVGSTGLARFSSSETSQLTDCLWVIRSRVEGANQSILADLLTEREMAVLNELSKDAANKVIARTLAISEPTVKFHLKNIYRKIGVNSRKLAIEMARRFELASGQVLPGSEPTPKDPGTYPSDRLNTETTQALINTQRTER